LTERLYCTSCVVQVVFEKHLVITILCELITTNYEIFEHQTLTFIFNLLLIQQPNARTFIHYMVENITQRISALVIEKSAHV